MAVVKIGEVFIGEDNPPFIVAEAGINHNGDLATAFKMIDVAKQAGVHAVKFQTFTAEEFCGDANQTFTYQSQGKQITESMLEMFKRVEFRKNEWQEIQSYCDDKNISFLSTPQNISDLELLLELGVSAIKVGSDDFTNYPLLTEYAKTRLPMIVSCGMANLAEVYQALECIGAHDGYPTILCLCTSQYPTPPEDVNLRKLSTLAAAFPMVVLGFSDHTQGALASSLAVGYGACFFEKHFTLHHDLPGPDHWFSENPQSLKLWVDSISTAYRMQGTGVVRPTDKEKEMVTLARRSIVALKDIKTSEEFTPDNLGLRRPGNGLPPSQINYIFGLNASHDIKKGDLLKYGDFS